MRMISSTGAAFFNRNLFLITLWIIILVFILILTYFSGERGGFLHKEDILAVLICVSLISFFLIKDLKSNIVDEVWENGDTLIMKKNGQEEIIPLTNIDSIIYKFRQVTLILHQPCKFGKEIVFNLLYLEFTRRKIIEELSRKVTIIKKSNRGTL